MPGPEDFQVNVNDASETKIIGGAEAPKEAATDTTAGKRRAVNNADQA